MSTELQETVDTIVAAMQTRTDRGQVASYIPELAKVNSDQFGMAIITKDDEIIKGGDADVPFSIQSVSKVFTLALALGQLGDRLWYKVGREPSGSPFNSIVQLEAERGKPRNPFINAGALAVTDIILAHHEPKEALGEILRFMQFLADDHTIYIDEPVAASEHRTRFRNSALANYMKSFGVVESEIDHLLGVYFHHCAIAMSTVQLAKAGRFLAFDGMNPSTTCRVLSPSHTRRINAIMLTCGHYDGSGEFAFRVGLPGKSGVGGSILAVAPGEASIVVWAPGLDSAGNSHLGRIALQMLVERTGWSVFAP